MIDEILKLFCGSGTETPEAFTCMYTLLLTIVTTILCVVGWVQLRGIKKTSKADFINKFNKDFFNKETQKLILLLSYNALEFKVAEIEYGDDSPSVPYPYFEVKQEVIQQFPHTGNDENVFQEKYSGFEMDDLLLGYFEEIGCFEKDNLIGIRGVYDGFDWYIQLAWDNSSIKEYIRHTRDEEPNGENIYEDFEYIYNKSKSFGDAKSTNRWMWLWEVRWSVSNWILKR